MIIRFKTFAHEFIVEKDSNKLNNVIVTSYLPSHTTKGSLYFPLKNYDTKEFHFFLFFFWKAKQFSQGPCKTSFRWLTVLHLTFLLHGIHYNLSSKNIYEVSLRKNFTLSYFPSNSPAHSFGRQVTFHFRIRDT